MTAPKRKPRQEPHRDHWPEIEERLDLLNAKIDAIGGLLTRVIPRPHSAAVPGDNSGIAYRSGRWH